MPFAFFASHSRVREEVATRLFLSSEVGDAMTAVSVMIGARASVKQFANETSFVNAHRFRKRRNDARPFGRRLAGSKLKGHLDSINISERAAIF